MNGSAVGAAANDAVATPEAAPAAGLQLKDISSSKVTLHMERVLSCARPETSGHRRDINFEEGTFIEKVD